MPLDFLPLAQLPLSSFADSPVYFTDSLVYFLLLYYLPHPMASGPLSAYNKNNDSVGNTDYYSTLCSNSS